MGLPAEMQVVESRSVCRPSLEDWPVEESDQEALDNRDLYLGKSIDEIVAILRGNFLGRYDAFLSMPTVVFNYCGLAPLKFLFEVSKDSEWFVLYLGAWLDILAIRFERNPHELDVLNPEFKRCTLLMMNCIADLETDEYLAADVIELGSSLFGRPEATSGSDL